MSKLLEPYHQNKLLYPMIQYLIIASFYLFLTNHCKNSIFGPKNCCSHELSQCLNCHVIKHQKMEISIFFQMAINSKRHNNRFHHSTDVYWTIHGYFFRYYIELSESGLLTKCPSSLGIAYFCCGH